MTDPVLLLANDAQVPALTDSDTVTEAAAARGARGLSPRSKRLLAAALELSPAATAAARFLRMRRAGFWGKVRVAVLAATLVAVAAADVALAAYLYARRANEWYAPLPPT